MKMKTTLLAAAAMSLLATSASAVDWGGYLRVGPGQKQSFKCADGGSDGGHGGIGRLGNECNTYGEFALSQGAQAGGVDYKATLMTNFYQPGSDPNGVQTAVNQIYVEGKGYDMAPNQTFWVGRRFYHRADVHFDDTFFVNMTGSGAGVDGFDLGVGTLSLAVFRQDDNGANPGSRLNVDLEGIKVNPGGKLRITGDFTKFSGTGGKSGTGISIQHNQSLGSWDNTAWFQYAQGSAYLDMGFGGATDDSGKKRWRFVESPSWTKGPLTGQGLFEFGEEKTPTLTGTNKRKYASAAGRLAYAFTKNFKLQGELGTSSFRWQDSAPNQTITKLTIAPTLAVGPNYYDRPELRLYVSTFSMNDAYVANHGLSKKTQSSVGVQAEIWF